MKEEREIKLFINQQTLWIYEFTKWLGRPIYFSYDSELDDYTSNKRKTREKTFKNQQELWIRA